MAFLTLVLDVPAKSIGELKSSTMKLDGSGNPLNNALECTTLIRNLFEGILAGTTDASVQATVRDTDPSVSTSGTGSVQITYNLK